MLCRMGQLRPSLGGDIAQGGRALCGAGEREHRRPAVGSGTMQGLVLVPFGLGCCVL